jgi:hypothetical protein
MEGSFLKQGYLYKAHKSLVIAGFDQWRWTAYLFGASIFGDEDDTEIDVQLRADETATEMMDPLARQMINTGHKMSEDPRQYSMTVAFHQLEDVITEWQFTVESMTERLKQYEQVSGPTQSFSIFKSRAESGSSDDSEQVQLTDTTTG